MKCPICGVEMEYIQFDGMYFYKCPMCKIWEDEK